MIDIFQMMELIHTQEQIRTVRVLLVLDITEFATPQRAVQIQMIGALVFQQLQQRLQLQQLEDLRFIGNAVKPTIMTLQTHAAMLDNVDKLEILISLQDVHHVATSIDRMIQNW